MRKLLIHAWSIQQYTDKLFIANTHSIYLHQISKYYESIVLLSPCETISNKDDLMGVSLDIFQKITVYKLPNTSKGYIGSIKYFFHYLKAYSKLKNIHTYYSRYPTPFGWLQKIFGKNSRRIIHYVGDPIDAATNNPNFSTIKKMIMTFFFKPEDLLYRWACKGAEVYTNGHHLAEKLKYHGIDALPLISSTLTKEDFSFTDSKLQLNKQFNFIYVGGLRSAKGVETIIKAFDMYHSLHPNSTLSIIGDGPYSTKLLELVNRLNNMNILFLGRIDNRQILNDYLRKSDIFLFGSLSEGSPRAVLEAMANGLLVVSTPVGSLPKIFDDGKDILFADFNSPSSFYNCILKISKDQNLFYHIRKNAFEKVQLFTNENFIKTIFYE